MPSMPKAGAEHITKHGVVKLIIFVSNDAVLF